MKITDIVLSFSDFLDHNWIKVNEILDQANFRDSFQKQDIINDWLQANWEVLVEYVVCKPGDFLSVYDSGADCHSTNHPMSERVTCPEKYPNYFVQCVPKPGLSKIKNYISDIDSNIEVADKDFCKFVSCSGGYYNDDVPFNFVLLHDESNITYVVSKYDIDFILVPI